MLTSKSHWKVVNEGIYSVSVPKAETQKARIRIQLRLSPDGAVEFY